MSERPAFDDRDSELLADRVFNRGKRPGPRVGDYVLMNDGRTLRITYDWGDAVQTTLGDAGTYGESFYLGKNGGCDFSGGLDRSIPVSTLVDTGEEREGSVWFFHHDTARAHNGVQAMIPCRVYRQLDLFPDRPDAVKQAEFRRQARLDKNRGRLIG